MFSRNGHGVRFEEDYDYGYALTPSSFLEDRSSFKLKPGPPDFERKLNFRQTIAPPLGMKLGSYPFRINIRGECGVGPGLICLPLGFQRCFENGCNIPHLPQLQLQKISGEVVEFPFFVQGFENFVELTVKMISENSCVCKCM